jgi:hypothetical protein
VHKSIDEALKMARRSEKMEKECVAKRQGGVVDFEWDDEGRKVGELKGPMELEFQLDAGPESSSLAHTRM